MRIVHLADADPAATPSDGALASIATLQQHDPEAEHLLIGIGSSNFREHARQFGARVDALVQSRSALTRSPANRLRKAIVSLGEIDSIQPWSSVTADLASRLPDLGSLLPPAPGHPPIIRDHVAPTARAHWRDRLGLAEHENAIALITDDTASPLAGIFGLILPPVTCTFQDRVIVGLIPETSAGQGSTRARRYAESAGEVWRIELVSAPLYAIATASDAVFCPGSSVNDSPWQASSAAIYAARCAKRLSVPVICSSFGATPNKPLIEDAIEPTRAGNVGIAAVLVDALTDQKAASRGEETGNPTEGIDPEAQRWIADWRKGAIAAGVACR